MYGNFTVFFVFVFVLKEEKGNNMFTALSLMARTCRYD